MLVILQICKMHWDKQRVEGIFWEDHWTFTFHCWQQYYLASCRCFKG